LTTAPRQCFAQQFLAQSSAALFRNNIKISHVRVKLRLVNRIRYFLEELHANMTEQLFTIIDNPAAPSMRTGAKTFPHP
jgi:hypothetical protein